MKLIFIHFLLPSSRQMTLFTTSTRLGRTVCCLCSMLEQNPKTKSLCSPSQWSRSLQSVRPSSSRTIWPVGQVEGGEGEALWWLRRSPSQKRPSSAATAASLFETATIYGGMSPATRASKWCPGPRRHQQHPPWFPWSPLCNSGIATATPLMSLLQVSWQAPIQPQWQWAQWLLCPSSSPVYPKSPQSQWRRTTAVRCVVKPSAMSTTWTGISCHTLTRSLSSVPSATSASRGRTAWPTTCARTTVVSTSPTSALSVAKVSPGGSWDLD